MQEKERHNHWEQDWLEGKISSAEAKSFAEDPASFEALSKYIETASTLKVPEGKSKEDVWNSIEANISASPKAKVISINRRYWLTGVAASFILIVSAFFLFDGAFEGKVNVSTELAEVQTIYLPDSSIVYLNAETEISYSKKGWETNRVLMLSGEAFFEVKRGSNFTVNTANGKVEVLGTSFNVRSRSQDFEVACKTGRVRVTEFLSETQQILTPGLKTKVKSGELIEPLELNVSNVDLWRSGEYFLESTSIEEGFEELERIFNIQIVQELSASELGRVGTWDFDKNNLTESIQSISQTMGFNFEIDGDKVIIKQK
ncbi:FecR family protein [Roseivirga sp. E12]|uniref:FecR family protein n=1 Tax=Roseivirga sp. E12 TaxID=2819237 RepID=UPI001ABC22E8|nr:FecR domain-containing protein [Roseivirga sp. E12]MBO3700243.1 FecR domain-containing protein [Roseivirga sp. E12]